MKRVRGYIFSRPFMGERVPQHVQNLVIRDYCKKNDLKYLLSATEYAMDDCYYMHDQLLNDLDNVDGIAAYSIFQLPMKTTHRSRIYRKILDYNKSYHFAVEGLSINNQHECERIESIWRIRQTLPYCYYYDKQ